MSQRDNQGNSYNYKSSGTNSQVRSYNLVDADDRETITVAETMAPTQQTQTHTITPTRTEVTITPTPMGVLTTTMGRVTQLIQLQRSD